MNTAIAVWEQHALQILVHTHIHQLPVYAVVLQCALACCKTSMAAFQWTPALVDILGMFVFAAGAGAAWTMLVFLVFRNFRWRDHAGLDSVFVWIRNGILVVRIALAMFIWGAMMGWFVHSWYALVSCVFNLTH
jgi:hypothetical protein